MYDDEDVMDRANVICRQYGLKLKLLHQILAFFCGFSAGTTITQDSVVVVLNDQVVLRYYATTEE